MPKWVQWFDKYRSTYIAISCTRVLQYRITGQSPKLYTGNSALQDRKQVQFFWIPFRPGDQSIFGLASFNFNSDPTCSVLRLSIVNSLRSVHWRKLISTLRMVNPFRMILPVGMTSVIYRLLVLQVHL